MSDGVKEALLETYHNFRIIQNQYLKMSREEFSVWLHENYEIEKSE